MAHTVVFALQCSPEFVPQITGGVPPLGPVIENVSVKHCVAKLQKVRSFDD
jgi:hypothetical protein